MPFIATTAAEQAQLAFFNYAKEQSKKSNERMSVVSSEIRCGWRVATKKKRNDFTCSVKDIQEDAQLLINYNIDNTTMCSFSGRHRCYYHRTDFEIFDHIITEAQRRKEMQEGRASRAAKRSHSEI